MRKLLLMLLLCIPVFALAQNKAVDSLKKVLATAKADTTRSDLYYKIALELQRMDPIQAQKMIEQSMAIAQKANFQQNRRIKQWEQGGIAAAAKRFGQSG